jgi:hypothetical protein
MGRTKRFLRLAVENFLTVTALGFSVFELGLIEWLDVLVAKVGPPAAVGGEGGDGEKRTPDGGRRAGGRAFILSYL